MTRLANSLATVLQHDSMNSGFRVVLGLKEGYEDNAPVHAIDEVIKALGSSCCAQLGEVFAIRSAEEKVHSIYTEPAAVIYGSLADLQCVYGLANAFGQERFTVEDFTKKASYCVETPYCTNPD